MSWRLDELPCASFYRALDDWITDEDHYRSYHHDDDYYDALDDYDEDADLLIEKE